MLFPRKIRKKVFNDWPSSASGPTGDKKDFVKKCIGEQDAAHSHIKKKISQVVLNRTDTIKTCFKCSSLKAVFFYVPSEGEEAVSRNRDGRKFKKIKGIRQWHRVKSSALQEKCINCIMSREAHCANKALMNDWKEVSIATDGSVATTKQARENTLDHD
ncbi:unnamed protein product, partial [Pocillopora meandrina]